MTPEFKKKIQEFQKSVHDFYKELYENAAFEDKREAKDMLYAQTTLLNKTGFRQKRVVKGGNSAPPKNPFKKRDFKADEVQEVKEIENKNVNESAFDKKDVIEIVNDDSQEIVNNAPKNPFEKKQIFDLKEKENPKRLSTEQKTAIHKLAAKGETIKAISDILMIVESKIESTLKKARKPKQNRNLIATSNKSSSEKFEKEVKESRNDED